MRIRSQSRLRLAWVFAILWNLISAPATFVGAMPAIQKGQAVAWVALLFPFVGAALLIWAVRLTLRFWRFGVSWLDLDGAAATVGAPLLGRLAAHHLAPEGAVRLTLTCINRVVRGSGKDRSVWEKVLWQEEQGIPAESLQPAPDGVFVPIAFSLPVDARATDTSDPDDSVLWRLEAAARLRGVDYDEQFEIPVAHAKPGKEPASSAGPAGAAAFVAAAGAAAGPAAAQSAAPVEKPDTSRIVVEPDERGGTRFVLPVGRNVRAIFVSCFYAFVFTGATVLLAYLARTSMHGILSGFVPFVMIVAFSLVSLAIILATLHTAFMRATVVAGPDGVAVTSNLLGISWTRRAARREIGDLTLAIDMQVGTTAYYDLKIAVRDGVPLTISSMLRDKREAEWLMGAIRQALR